MTSASSDSLIASKGGGWKQPPKTSETTKSITMKFLPDIGIDKEAQNQNKIWHYWSGL